MLFQKIRISTKTILKFKKKTEIKLTNILLPYCFIKNLAHPVKINVCLTPLIHIVLKKKRFFFNALHFSFFLLQMGELMTKSHISLRDDFQVSCVELDVLVDAAINCPGVLGSRMTGGGFGGCTVSLVQRAAINKVISTMRESFIKKFNKEAGKNLEFYVCKPSDGARCLAL